MGVADSNQQAHRRLSNFKPHFEVTFGRVCTMELARSFAGLRREALPCQCLHTSVAPSLHHADQCETEINQALVSPQMASLDAPAPWRLMTGMQSDGLCELVQ